MNKLTGADDAGLLVIFWDEYWIIFDDLLGFLGVSDEEITVVITTYPI